jgi:hypothetical protein
MDYAGVSEGCGQKYFAEIVQAIEIAAKNLQRWPKSVGTGENLSTPMFPSRGLWDGPRLIHSEDNFAIVGDGVGGLSILPFVEAISVAPASPHRLDIAFLLRHLMAGSFGQKGTRR